MVISSLRRGESALKGDRSTRSIRPWRSASNPERRRVWRSGPHNARPQCV